MRFLHSNHILMLGTLLLVACAGCPGTPPNHDPVEFRRQICLARPAAGAPPTVIVRPELDPDSALVAMLAKGYAVVGTISCDDYTARDESAVSKRVLLDAQQHGAEFVWLRTGRQSHLEFWYRHGGSGQGTNAVGQQYTYWLDSNSGSTEYPYIFGWTTMFVRDSTLAARQLQQVRDEQAAVKREWESARTKHAQLPNTRPIMIDKLTRIRDTLRGYDASVLQTASLPERLRLLIVAMENACSVLRTDEDMNGSMFFEAGKDVVKYALEFLQDCVEPGGKHYAQFFRDPRGHEYAKLNGLLDDARKYYAENVQIRFEDVSTQPKVPTVLEILERTQTRF